MGTRDGSIIATIITTHMPRNDAAAPSHVWPGIRIQAIDIVQPPGIGIPPIADMDVHQMIVTAVLAAKRSAETPKKAGSEARPEIMSAPTVREGARSGSLAGNIVYSLTNLGQSFASASRFRKAASPASDTSPHFESSEASA